MSKPQEKTSIETDEHLQFQLQASTKRYLGIYAAENCEPLSVVVLKALKAYGVTLPLKTITDRRKRRE